MVENQSLLDLREKAFGADLDSLSARLSELTPAELAHPAAIEIYGVSKYRSGDVPGAVALLAQAVATPRHQAHLKSLLFLMRGQYAAGDADAALLTARRAIDIDPANQEALRLAGRVFNQRQDWDRADRFWRQLCEVAPLEIEAAIQVARIAGRRAEWETQAFFADLVLRANPDHLEALRLAIAGRLRSQRLDGVEALLPVLYRAEPPRALEFLRSINQPEQAERLAEILARLKALAPDDDGLWRLAADKVKAWLALAPRQEISRKDDLAALLFRAARRVNPGSRDAAAGLQRLVAGPAADMRAALKARDETTALDHGRRVVAIDPEMEEAWFAMGRLTLTSDSAYAADCFAHAAELRTDDPWLLLNLGRGMERAERYVEAVQAYASVVRLIADPANDRRLEAVKSIGNSRQRLIRRGRNAFGDGRLEDAWADYSAAAAIGEAADLEPNLTAIRRAMFLALRERFKSDDPEFIAAAEAYLRLDPDHAETLLYLGRKLMPARRHARARQVWERLARLEPAEAHYQLQIARCCAWLKLKAEGAAAAAAALRLDPTLGEAASLAKQFAAA